MKLSGNDNVEWATALPLVALPVARWGRVRGELREEEAKGSRSLSLLLLLRSSARAPSSDLRDARALPRLPGRALEGERARACASQAPSPHPAPASQLGAASRWRGGGGGGGGAVWRGWGSARWNSAFRVNAERSSESPFSPGAEETSATDDLSLDTTFDLGQQQHQQQQQQQQKRATEKRSAVQNLTEFPVSE
ncbi:unnamed protein product [Lampetra fluviatilis]